MGKKLPIPPEWIHRPILRNASKEQQQLYNHHNKNNSSNSEETTTIVLLDDEEDSSISYDDSHSSDETELILRTKPHGKLNTTGTTMTVTTTNELQQQQLSKVRIVKLMFGVFGIYGAYLSYGLYQEDLYRYKANDGTTVRCVWFLQVLESAASIALGGIGRKIWGGTRNIQLRPFLLSGAAQVFAKVFMSLSLVMGASFPVATLAKSAKIVPVMIGQLLLGGASYNVRDYAFAILVVSGTVLLSLGKTNHSTTTEGSNDTIPGVCFILLSLVMDGCVGGLQKQMKRDLKDNPPSTYDYVFFSHISMIAIALAASLLTGDFWTGLKCLIQHPPVAKMVAAVCLLSVIGQSFIFYVIASFDPLVCATITTTRKIWSVLLSIAFKGYTLSMTGYAGLVLAILGLGMEVDQKARPLALLKTKHTDELV